MAEPARNIYDDENEGSSSSAYDRARKQWGMPDPEQPEDEEADLDNVASLDTARKRKGIGSDELADAESAGATPEASNADKSEKKAAEPEDANGGWKTNIKRAKSNMSAAKKLGIAGGIAGLLAAGLIALFSFLLPFKLTHIVESIEQRVGQVPEYAVERRIEYYMSRYMMIRSLEATGNFDFSPGGADRNRFTYLGSGFWDTMYTNWKGAKLEEKLATNYGQKITALNTQPDLVFRDGKLRANEFKVESIRPGNSSTLDGKTLDRGEVRQLIRDFSKQETKSRQVFKRFHIRKVMKKYYGVGNWKPFEKLRDDTSNKYYEKKRAFQKRLVNETVGRLSERYDKYFECLLGATSSKACRDILKRADPDINLPDAEKNQDGRTNAEGEIDNTADPGDSAENRRLAARISDKLEELGIKKSTQALFATVTTAIGIASTVSQLYGTLDSGVINQVIYDKNAQQYLAYSAPILSAADQIRAGENNFDIEDVRSAHEIFNNYGESPVYQAGSPSSSTVSAAGRVSRDCNNNDSDGNETLLEEGETVCPEKRLVQDETSFTNSEGWQALGRIVSIYDGTIGKIVNLITSITETLVDKSGLDSVIQAISGFLNVDEATGKAFGFLLNRIAGPVITGAEVDGDAYDALYAGIAVQQSGVGGDVGISKEDTIGGAYLSDAQVAAIRESQMDDYYQELDHKSFFARYFSPSVKESLVGNFAMTMPTSVTGFSQQAAAAISNPGSLFGSLGSLFSPKARAQTLPDSNPFHVINMGFPADHEIFTANNGSGMDPDDIQARYQCNKPVDQRPQNQAFGHPDDLPFDVPTQVDPCLLETSAMEASTKYFTGSYDEGIDGGGSTAATQAAGTSIVGDPFSASDGVACAPGTNDLGIQDGYNEGTLIKLRLCAIPNIASSGQESTPGNTYYVEGANGFAIASSRVSGAVFAMAQAAKTAGVTLFASSTFRTAAHQQALWDANPNSTYVAPPGQSNHQTGVAIDFRAGSVKGGTTCDKRAGAPGNAMWDWLFANAERFGYKQYSAESWHWDPSASASRCDSSQPATITINSRVPL